MTWDASITGHTSSPEEEALIEGKIRSALVDLRRDGHDVISASFHGSFSHESGREANLLVGPRAAQEPEVEQEPETEQE